MSARTPLALTLVLALGLAAWGCSSSTAPSGPVNIAGNWDFTGSFTNNQISSSCQVSSSTVTLTQTGNAFSGAFTGGTENCTISGAKQSFSLVGLTFTGGQISGEAVSFVDDGGCTYKGTVSGSPTNKMSGTLDCVTALGAADTLSGNWQASR